MNGPGKPCEFRTDLACSLNRETMCGNCHFNPKQSECYSSAIRGPKPGAPQYHAEDMKLWRSYAKAFALAWEDADKCAERADEMMVHDRARRAPFERVAPIHDPSLGAAF